ncbi:unnamed protein product [Lampetra fluviatilis]
MDKSSEVEKAFDLEVHSLLCNALSGSGGARLFFHRGTRAEPCHRCHATAINARRCPPPGPAWPRLAQRRARPPNKHASHSRQTSAANFSTAPGSLSPLSILGSACGAQAPAVWRQKSGDGLPTARYPPFVCRRFVVEGQHTGGHWARRRARARERERVIVPAIVWITTRTL